jgi:pimeloyl-ACP methyl ester carboxylesterase
MAVTREFVSMESPTMSRGGAGGRPCQGVWHTPPGGSPRSAVIATHYEVDFSEHYLADFVAERGIGFLGWNTRYRGAGPFFTLKAARTDIGVGVRWLRDQAGVDTIILLGNSGGASLMSAYQSEAVRTGDLLAGDLFISLNAHRGRPDVLTTWLDPSVTDEADPLSVDGSIDMFDAAHGPPYPPAFVAGYRAGQVARNDRITGWCRAELDRLGASGATDRVFTVARTCADLRFCDLAIDPSERTAGCYAGDPRRANYAAFGLASTCTCRSWLEMWSLEASPCRAEPHLERMTIPSLVVQSLSDQGCFPSDAQALFGAVAAADKTLEWVPGDHYLRDSPELRDDVADLLVDWARSRGAR